MYGALLVTEEYMYGALLVTEEYMYGALLVTGVHVWSITGDGSTCMEHYW